MSQPAPYVPYSPPPRPSKTGPIITIVVGLVLVIGGPLAGLGGGVASVVPKGIDYADSVARLNPTATVNVKAGEAATLLTTPSVASRVTASMCTARSATGSTADVTDDSSDVTVTVNGTEYRPFARVTASTDGAYVIDCQTAAEVVVAPHLDVRGMVGSLLWWIVGGSIVALIGLVVLVVGIVKLVRVNKMH